MSLQIDERPGGLLSGSQTPRVCTVPPFVSSAGAEAVDLARQAGLVLDPWQAFVLERSLGERRDGQWAAFEVGLVVPRQNGKGSILEARELAGLFLLGERMIIHSAHQFDTSLEAFRRLLYLVEDNPDFSRRVKRVSRSHGEEGIELTTGQRIRFRTRTKGGGRGFSGDCLILDEAMVLPEMAHAALLPTLSARPNPQVWYAASAVDQLVHEHGRVLTRVRARGLAGDDPKLAFFEWSPDVSLDHSDLVAEDRDVWAQANPGLGIRILEEHVAAEQRSMDPRTFAVERLGIGDWPSLDVLDGDLISKAQWVALADPESKPVDPVVFSYDVTPDRGASCITVAARRSDDRVHVEVVDHRPGTGWVADRLAELVGRHRAAKVVADERGPAAALLTKVRDLGVSVETIGARELGEACGQFYDLVVEQQLAHLGTEELMTAVRGAARRPLGDAWAWSRKSSTVDISPLVACTLACWGVQSLKPSMPFVGFAR